MSARIAKCFETLRKKNEKALIAFVTAGDPTPGENIALIQTLISAGVDIIEIGMPFSDAMADGPVIQRANARALAAGMNLEKMLHLVEQVRAFSEIPLVAMGYANPVLRYGRQRFRRDFLAAGGDGLLIVDEPLEEMAPSADNLDDIFLVSPTTTPERFRAMLPTARGYLYYISMEGVTGSALSQIAVTQKRTGEFRRKTKLPLVVGFGIRTPEQARALGQNSDGVVVGSALIEMLEGRPFAQACVMIGELAASLKAALR